MKEATLKKSEVVEYVQDNLAKHREMFEEAVKGYRKRAVELLDDHIKRIKDGKVEQVQVYLPAPEDHTADYERVLLMLEMEVSDTVVLSAREFEQLIMDRWVWKDEFLGTVATYTGVQ